MLKEVDMATHRPIVRKILTMADFGGGKTHLLRTIVRYKPAAPLLLYSFDRGYDTAAMTPGIQVVDIQEEDRRKPKAWMEFNEHFRKFTGGHLEYTWPDGRKERYKSCGLDGLPWLSQFCLNYYQFMGSNVDKKASYTQYQQILENMQDVIDTAKRCPEWVIATALVKTEKNELTGEVYSEPDLIGSIRHQLGSEFDAVFFQYVDRLPTGKTVYKLKTVGGYREKGKIRIPSEIRDCVAPVIEDPSFDKLMNAIDTKIESVYGSLAKPPVEAPKSPSQALVVAPRVGMAPVASMAPVAKPVNNVGVSGGVSKAPTPVKAPKASVAVPNAAKTGQTVPKVEAPAAPKQNSSGFKPPTPRAAVKIKPRVR